jgi:hypothetical protein
MTVGRVSLIILFLTLEEMICFSLYDVGYKFVIHSLYCVVIYSFYSEFLQSFYHKRMLNFVEDFFCISLDYYVIFALDSVYCCITFFLMCFEVWFTGILLRIFASMFVKEICL